MIHEWLRPAAGTHWCRREVLSPPNPIMSAFRWARKTRRPSYDHRDDEHAEGSQHVLSVSLNRVMLRGHKTAIALS